jgi:predicted dehydrogenase
MTAQIHSSLIERVLIIGFGSIGERHLRIARSLLPNADIRILRHQPSGEVPSLANGALYLIEDAVAFSPQVAVISSPASFHLKFAGVLAKAGVHLLIEKPLSNSMAGIDQLLEDSHRQGIVLMVGYNLRFLSSLQYFRRVLVEEGIVGKVLSVRCEAGQYLPSWRPKGDYRECVSGSRELGGGVLLELSHELDYLRWIFGEVAWVKATLSKQSDLVIDVEDSAALTLGFEPQVNGWQLIGSLNLDFIRQDDTRGCVAIGEFGSLRWNGLTGEVSLYGAGAREWKTLFSCPNQRDESYISEWKHFFSCIDSKDTPLISGEDGRKVLQIIDAARSAATSKHQVLITK